MDKPTNSGNGDAVRAIEAEPSLSRWLISNGPTVAIVAAGIGYFAWKGLDLLIVGRVALGLGLLIFVHELGHFLAAKWCDVHVETFSIGFGPALPFCSYQWGETTYMIGAFPLGGYVKMVGEGSDGDEGEDDPRSFKNKSVKQRMLIISAGVIMNLLLAAIGFIAVYRTTGIEELAGEVGAVDSGSPSWRAGVISGSLLEQIGSVKKPYFDDLRASVVLSSDGEKVPLAFIRPDKPNEVIETVIEPRFEKDRAGMPLIGVAPASRPVLSGSVRQKVPPFERGSAGSKATPVLETEDRIVKASNPADPSGALTDLRADPFDKSGHERDFFDLYNRLVDMAGQPIKFEVERTAGNQIVTVPPAFYRDLGLCLRMGQIAAIRDHSPASKAGLQAADSNSPGDIIEAVEVPLVAGGVMRFVANPSAQPPNGVTELRLDPFKLPDQLQQWALKNPASTDVRLTVRRRDGHDEGKKVDLTLQWDPRWRYSREMPFMPRSPWSIPGLGLAYQIEGVVEYVQPGGPAELAGVKVNDNIKAIQHDQTPLNETAEQVMKWTDYAPEQFAYAFALALTDSRGESLSLRVQRGGDKQPIDLVLNPGEDVNWPRIDRGILFDMKITKETANSWGEALSMGGRRTVKSVGKLYLALKSMVGGRISFTKNATGPLSIAITSYNVASESFPRFVMLLCIISINLAVINFLPIPVLDGGHMMMLLYEGLRGRPAPESLRVAATFAGLALIGTLFVVVIVLDVMRHWNF